MFTIIFVNFGAFADEDNPAVVETCRGLHTFSEGQVELVQNLVGRVGHSNPGAVGKTIRAGSRVPTRHDDSLELVEGEPLEENRVVGKVA